MQSQFTVPKLKLVFLVAISTGALLPVIMPDAYTAATMMKDPTTFPRKEHDKFLAHCLRDIFFSMRATVVTAALPVHNSAPAILTQKSPTGKIRPTSSFASPGLDDVRPAETAGRVRVRGGICMGIHACVSR